jgi:CheY-like chemotaxis protein
MMEVMGHKVEFAYSAKEALDVAVEFKPEIILLDIGMPVMNGYELCKEMRRDAALEKAVFIAQTGWGQDRHLQRSKEAGFDFHLIKPISFEILQSHLKNIKPSS